MHTHTHTHVIIHGEKLHVFVDYFTNTKVFDEFLHMNTMKLVKANNHESFYGVKVKMCNFFTANTK